MNKKISLNLKAMLAILLITLCLPLAAQSRIIEGRVADSEGIGLLGAIVVDSENPSNGVISNEKGEFQINVTAETAALSVSMLGFQTQTVTAKGQTPIYITMQEDVQDIDEVVVVGYGSMKRSDITGAVATVKSEDLMSAYTPSLGEALQGKVPGLNVSTTSAAPGGGVSIRIRGTNSLLSDANPLYVVDGFAVDDISYLNVSDIASVEVLKDASSTAIYGSRGANGVILIETHKGKSSTPTVNFTSYVGVQQVYREVELLNGEQFAELYNEYCRNEGNEEYYDGSHRDRPLPSEIGEGTDWYDQIMQIGLTQSYDLSLTGGSDKMTYRIAGGYYGNKGVILGGDYSSIRFNATNKIKINDWADLNLGLFLTRNDTNGSGDRTGLESNSGTLNSALKMSPTINVYDENGNYNANYFPNAQGTENPVAYANETLNNTVLDNITANVTLVAEPIKDLSLQVKFGANVKDKTARGYVSNKTIEGAKVNGEASLGEQSYQTLVNEYVVNYKKKINKHSFHLTGAFSLESYETEAFSISGTGIAIDNLSYAGIMSAQVVSQPIFDKYSSTLISSLARLNYNYDNRYLFTITTRIDGNSGFADGHKWGNFPSAAFAWRANNEKFMKGLTKINDLKLRLSYGVTGNSKVGIYRSLGLLDSYRYPVGDQTLSGMGPSSIANPELTWEKTAMYNAGVDLSMFKHRLRFSVDAYYKLTSDMLMSYDLPSTSSFARAYVNAGELENKGIEFALNGVAYKSDDWTVSLGASLAMNRDKVLELYDGEPLTIDIGDKQTIWIREGSPIREFFALDVAGIFQSQEEIDNYTWTNPETGATKKIQGTAQPGDIKYYDHNNDGTIDSDDNVSYGSAMPDFTYGINCNVNYKNWAFDMFINGSEGNIIQNRNMAYLRNTTLIRNNMSADLLDRWTPENTDASVPRLGSEDSLPTFEDGSYLRIQNVSLSYTLPQKYVSWARKITLAAGVDNLYVWTKYSGWDPDVNSAFGGSDNVNIGQDVNSYPKPRIYRFSINATF